MADDVLELHINIETGDVRVYSKTGDADLPCLLCVDKDVCKKSWLKPCMVPCG